MINVYFWSVYWILTEHRCLCLCRTFFLWSGGFCVHPVFLRVAAVALLLQQVADENSQQPHHTEDGHQCKHGVLRALLLWTLNVGGVCTIHSFTNVTSPPAVWLCGYIQDIITCTANAILNGSKWVIQCNKTCKNESLYNIWSNFDNCLNILINWEDDWTTICNNHLSSFWIHVSAYESIVHVIFWKTLVLLYSNDVNLKTDGS